MNSGRTGMTELTAPVGCVTKNEPPLSAVLRDVVFIGVCFCHTPESGHANASNELRRNC